MVTDRIWEESSQMVASLLSILFLPFPTFLSPAADSWDNTWLLGWQWGPSFLL